MDIGNWTFESTHGATAIDWIAEGTTLYPGAYCTYTPHYRWLDNSEEAIIISDSKGEEVDRTPVVSDNESDNRYWIRNNSEWTFGVKELEKGELGSGPAHTLGIDSKWYIFSHFIKITVPFFNHRVAHPSSLSLVQIRSHNHTTQNSRQRLYLLL